MKLKHPKIKIAVSKIINLYPELVEGANSFIASDYHFRHVPCDNRRFF